MEQIKEMAKTGRNDKCPCGSGLKYKKCCLDKETALTSNIQNTPKRLIIIGNGFDLHHGMACKYADFMSFLLKNRKDVVEIMARFYDIRANSELWSDFETNLESGIDWDNMTNIIFDNVPDIASDDFRDRDWYNAQLFMEQECDALLNTIRSGFEDWINSIPYPENIHDNKYVLDSDALYLTFNYTETLEDIYNIPSSRILHIHNKVGEQLIFGHGKNSDDFNVQQTLYGEEDYFIERDETGEIISSPVGHEQFAEQSVVEFYNKMRKPVEEIIASNYDFFNRLFEIDEIIVIGHSYNAIDYPYFHEISESINTDVVRWYLHYFNDEDYEKAKHLMTELGISDKLVSYIND